MSIFGNKEEKKTDKPKDEKNSPKVAIAKKAKPAAKKSMKDLYGAEKSSSAKASPLAKASGDKPQDKALSAKASEGKAEPKKDLAASNSYRVLLRPLLTEKGSHLGIQNKYLFEVGYNTNKIEVAKAIEAAYGVKPTKVNIIKLAGKVVRRGRTAGRRKNWKKAIVTLPAGKTIQIYEGI